jgi:ppGpp synthetase/RelA/SpoT-type nucleotidyltranferase
MTICLTRSNESRAKAVEITSTNCFREITDFAGVRILHLSQNDFGKIKEVIDAKCLSEEFLNQMNHL